MKKIFIVPGFRDRVIDKKYVWLKSFLSEKGFDVSIVPIHWNHRTMTDYVLEFEHFYESNKAGSNYILGFSYGAVIAFITASKLRPKKIFLCSLSPDFKEDIPQTGREELVYIGKHRVADSLTRSGRRIAKELTVPTTLFYGEKEGKQYPQLKIRCEETAKLNKMVKLIVVKNAPHDISHSEYMKAIKTEF